MKPVDKVLSLLPTDQLIPILKSEAKAQALAELIYGRYFDLLKGIAYNKAGKMTNADLLVDEMISDFYNHWLTPTATGEDRLAHYDDQEPFPAYLARAFGNFANDWLSKRSHLSAIETDIEPLPITDTDAEDQDFRRMQYRALLLTLEELDEAQDREAYIWCTYALASALKADDGVRPEGRLYLQMAQQLGITESNAKQIGSRMARLIKSKAKNNLDNINKNCH